jgi:hypothetical protein
MEIEKYSESYEEEEEDEKNCFSQPEILWQSEL